MQASNFLEDTHLRRLANPTASIVRVSSKEKLRAAWETMIKHNVYSVPVYDVNSNKYVGLLSLGAIVRAVVTLFADRAGGLGNLSNRTFGAQEINDITYAFNQLEVRPDLIAHVEVRRPGINIQEAINFFVNPGNDKTSVRLPIVDEDGLIINIVSPTMILKFITAHLDQLSQDLLNREIGKITGVVTPSVSTIRTSERALDAFATMVRLGYSALGCEDADAAAHRHIISVISYKDAGHALKDLNRLLLPVEEFVNEIRRADLIDRAPTMSVATTDTLLHTIRKFVTVQRHRMFVRDPHTNEMVGIVTVSDVLKAFATAQHH